MSKYTRNNIGIEDVVEGGDTTIPAIAVVNSSFTSFPGTNTTTTPNSFSSPNLGFTISGVDVGQYYTAINEIGNSAATGATATKIIQLPNGTQYIKGIAIGGGGGGGGGGAGEFNENHNFFSSSPSQRWTAMGGTGGGGAGYSSGATHPVAGYNHIQLNVGGGGILGNGGSPGGSGNNAPGYGYPNPNPVVGGSPGLHSQIIMGNSANSFNYIYLTGNPGSGGSGGAGGGNHGTPVSRYNSQGGWGNVTNGNIGNYGDFGADGDSPGPAGNGGSINNSGSYYPTINTTTYGKGGNGGGGGHGSGGGNGGESGTTGYIQVYFLF